MNRLLLRRPNLAALISAVIILAIFVAGVYVALSLRPHPRARVWFKQPIAQTALPIKASIESSAVSEPLEILEDGPTWLRVRLATGEELSINQDLVAGLIDDSHRTPAP